MRGARNPSASGRSLNASRLSTPSAPVQLICEPIGWEYNCRDRKTRHLFCSCIPVANLVQLRAASAGVELAHRLCISFLRTSRINNPEGDVYEMRERCEGGC